MTYKQNAICVRIQAAYRQSKIIAELIKLVNQNRVIFAVYLPVWLAGSTPQFTKCLLKAYVLQS